MTGPTGPTSAQPLAQPLKRWGPRAVPTGPTLLACVHMRAVITTTLCMRKQVRQVSPVGTDVVPQRIDRPNLSDRGLGRLGQRGVLPGSFNIRHDALTTRSGSAGSSPTFGLCGFPARSLPLDSAVWLWFGRVRIALFRFGEMA